MSSERRSSRVWLQRGTLVLVSLTLAIVSMEAAARAFHLGSGGFWEPHPLYGWRNIPGADGWESCYGECAVHVRINSHGLRDAETSYRKLEHTQRILLLGDSMSAGLQVPLEETFAQRLEQRMSEAGHDWEVVNAAVNGYGTDNALLFFQHEGRKYEPDIVILGMYLANDVYNNHHELEVRFSGSGHKPYFTIGADGTLELHNFPVQKTDSITVRLGTFLKRHFQLPRFLAQVLRLRSDVPNVLRPLVHLFTGDRGAAQAVFQAESAAPQGDICSDEYSPQVEQAWDITKKLIGELRLQVEASGAELVVLVIPAAPQLEPPTAGGEWYCNRANQELAGYLQTQGIRYLDLLEPFREHSVAGGPRLYYERDFHLNSAGHLLTAELLSAELMPEVAGE